MHPPTPVRLGRRTAVVLIAASLAALIILAWPLLVPVEPSQGTTQAALSLAGLLPVIVLTVLASMADGGMDAKSLAMLGVLAATVAALRPLGAGVGGVEPMVFLLICAGRVFGPGFGFALGGLSLLASAFLTGGIGPWMPAQMVVCAWVGMGAGLLPRRLRGRAEVAALCLYGVVASYVFGFLMNLWFWPSLAGVADSAGTVSYVPGGGTMANLQAFGMFTLVTSTASWDTMRAIATVLLLVVVGPSTLHLLRRAARRAAFATTP
ncbi:MAG: ECF transporter S component [Micrococcales bacterium]|nr:ECF transporter S component [Micrococcales bacterium]